MKFGILVCPKCKKAKVVILSYKTTRCHGCGKVFKIDKIKILYRTDSEKKLKHSLGLINAKIDGKLEKFKEKFKNQIYKNYLFSHLFIRGKVY
jgi:hypothetical protein